MFANKSEHTFKNWRKQLITYNFKILILIDYNIIDKTTIIYDIIMALL